MEAAVAKQAEKVRSLKTSGADKKVWQPEVDILLDLKKKLTAATGAPAAPAAKPAKQPKKNETSKTKTESTPQKTLTDEEKTQVKQLEEEIEKQVC